MKKLVKIVFLVALVGVVASVVASFVSNKKLSNMSDDEIRDFLAAKLSSKVGGDQLKSIQDAVIAGLRRSPNGADGTAGDGEGLVQHELEVGADTVGEVST